MVVNFVCRVSKAQKDGLSPLELSIIINVDNFAKMDHFSVIRGSVFTKIFSQTLYNCLRKEVQALMLALLLSFILSDLLYKCQLKIINYLPEIT